jgi:hypothetical protein
MPGLLRGIARTAVVAGIATAVSNGVSRRQVGRCATQDQQQYAAQKYEKQQYASLPRRCTPRHPLRLPTT